MKLVPSCSVVVLMLAGCGGPTSPTAPANTVVPPVTTPVVGTTTSPMASPEAPRADPDSAEAAAAVAQRYFALISAQRYDDAYALWEPRAIGMNAADFASAAVRYAGETATVGSPGLVDAGAGQRYVAVPVNVMTMSASGKNVALAGDVMLHRVADIDGASPEQRAWRIRSSDLKPRP